MACVVLVGKGKEQLPWHCPPSYRDETSHGEKSMEEGGA